jgi:hypothetical protein
MRGRSTCGFYVFIRNINHARNIVILLFENMKLMKLKSPHNSTKVQFQLYVYFTLLYYY